jgi:hypothetical protein
LKPDVSPIQDGGPEGETSLDSLEMLLKTLHCENDQTKTSSFSHDWHVQPDCQRSITGVRLSGPFWIKEYTAKLCVLELVALHFAGCLPTLAIYAHLPKLQSFRELVNGYFFHLLKRACSTKFERSAQAHSALVGILPKRGNSPSPCNGLFALEGLSFTTACCCSPCSRT